MVKYRCTLTMAGIQYPYYKSLVEIDHWCEENCCGKWRHGKKGLSTVITVYIFVEETDAMAFKLRWM